MDSKKSVMAGIAPSLAALVVAPLVVVGTLVLLLAQGLHQFPLAVATEDQGFDMPMAGHVNLPEKLVAAIDADAFAVTTVKTLSEAKALFESGKVKAYLGFPAELTQNMMLKVSDPTYVLPDRIALAVSADNPLVRVAVLGSLARGFGPVVAESGGLDPDSLLIPLDLAALVSGFEGALPYVVSTLLGFLAYVLTGLLALFAALGLRRRGEFDPKKAIATALGFAFLFAVAGWAQYALLSTTVFVLVGLPLTASLYTGSAAVFLLLLVAPLVALAAAANAPTEEHARPVIPFLILPLFLGGILFPAELLPSWLQWLEFLFPPHYGLNAASAVTLGRAASTVPLDLILTGVWAAAFLGLAVVGLTRKEKSL